MPTNHEIIQGQLDGLRTLLALAINTVDAALENLVALSVAEPENSGEADPFEHWEAEVLATIVDELQLHPCMHGPAGTGHGATPPMMYPNWIRCIINQAKIEGNHA